MKSTGLSRANIDDMMAKLAVQNQTLYGLVK